MRNSLLFTTHIRQVLQTFSLLLILTGFSTYLTAQSLPAGFARSEVQTGYTTPIGAVFSADGTQLFVWEKAGRVFVSNWNGTSYVRQDTPVIDISDEVGNWGDGGFLSTCLDPNFSSNGLLYLYYVVDRHHLLNYGTDQYNKDANQYDNATITRVTRYRVTRTAGTLAAENGSRQVLIGETKTTGIPMIFPSHVGGTLVFGRDGSLLISTGDNSYYDGADIGSNGITYYQTALNDGIMRSAENVGALRAQMTGSLCGKVLRIDPNTGNGIGSNPFFDPANPRAPQSRVWTLGLRNPYRMSIQPSTGSTSMADGNPGTLLVGDIGWATAEEVNVVGQGGLNCGWPLYEGMDKAGGYYGRNIRNQDEAGQPTFESLCLDPTSPTITSNPAFRRFTHYRPALDWLHSEPIARVPDFQANTPITRLVGSAGGPAGTPFSGNASIGGVYYTGTQFPTSYQNSYFFADFGQNWIRNLVIHQDGDIHEVREFAPSGFGQNIVALTTSPLDGSLYYVSTNGQIMRISYGGNQPPLARPTADLTTGSSPLTVHFSGDSSTDPEAKPLTYRWDFGDGATSEEANPVHLFTSSDEHSFTVTLTVTDAGGLSHAATLTISLNSTAPTAHISSPLDGSLYPLDRASLYTLKAEVTGDNLTYEWQVALHHNEHEHPEPVLTQVSPQIRISPVGCSATDSYSYRISLKVTNRSGLSTTTSIRIYPDCQSANGSVQQVTATPLPNAARINWQNPAVSFDEVLVAAHAGIGFRDNPSGTNYTADANFGGTGTAFDGGKVVYRGGGAEVTVSNLTPSLPYFFRVYTRIGDTWNGGVEVTAIPGSGITNPLTLIAPLYNCTTGALTFRTSGGSNALIEYAAMGITDWTANPNQMIDAGLRGDPKVLLLNARQDGVQVTYTFDLPAACRVPSTNQSPLVNAVPASLSATQQQPFSYVIPAATFTDPNGDALAYAMSGLPNGLFFNPATATLSGTPTTTGQATLTLTATDPGNLSVSTQFAIVISPASTTTTPPTTTPPITAAFSITGVTMVSCETLSVGQRQLSFTPQYAGLTGQAVTFQVIGEMLPTTSAGPYTLRIYTDNPTIRVQAQQNGTAGIASYAYNWLTACNSGPASTTLSPPPPPPPPVNQPPVVAQLIGSQQATVEQPFSYVIPAATFTDPNGDALAYAMSGLPNGLFFNPATATLSGTPTTTGQATLTLTATDPGNLSVSTQFAIVISPASTTTTPPTTTPPITAAFSITGVTMVSCETLSVGQRQLSFTPQYAGLTGQAVTFQVIGEMLPTTSAGPYTLRIYTDNPTIRVQAQQNGTAGIASYAYNWLTACNSGPASTTLSPPPPPPPPVNQPPVVAQLIGSQQATVEQPFSYVIPAATFTDPNGDALAYAMSGLPNGLFFNPATATLSGTPTTTGQATLTLTATDPGNLSVSTQFAIVISPASTTTTPPTTTPPITAAFSITGVRMVSCETTGATQRRLNFTPQYSGLNGQAVTFSVVNEMSPTTSPGPYVLTLYTDNPTINLRAEQADPVTTASFAYNWLAACTAGSGRLGALESVETLTVWALGNPVLTETADIEIRGAASQSLRVRLYDGQGRIVSDSTIPQAASVERHILKLTGPVGLYLLHVSTTTQHQILKLIKQ